VIWLNDKQAENVGPCGSVGRDDDDSRVRVILTKDTEY
jgi:hypothetical protein